MRSRDHGLEIGDPPARAGVLQQYAESPLDRRDAVVRPDDHTDAQRLGTGFEHSDGLRVAIRVDDEHVAGLVVEPVAHRHRFGRRGGLVEQRRVGKLHPGQVGDHGLEVHQRLESAL